MDGVDVDDLPSRNALAAAGDPAELEDSAELGDSAEFEDGDEFEGPGEFEDGDEFDASAEFDEPDEFEVAGQLDEADGAVEIDGTGAPVAGGPAGASAEGDGDDEGGGDDPGDGHDAGGGLTGQERQVLAFERQWWRHAGSKEQAIRDQFAMSSTRYYQLLNVLLDSPAALASDPVLIKRLRRLRATRTRARSGGRVA